MSKGTTAKILEFQVGIEPRASVSTVGWFEQPSLISVIHGCINVIPFFINTIIIIIIIFIIIIIIIIIIILYLALCSGCCHVDIDPM